MSRCTGKENAWLSDVGRVAPHHMTFAEHYRLKVKESGSIALSLHRLVESDSQVEI